MITKKDDAAKLADLKMAILEFLLENTENDRYANTGKRVYVRLKEIFGDVIKRSTVYYNLKVLTDESLLETKEDVVRGDNNQPNTVVRYNISGKYKNRITEKIRAMRRT